MRRRNSGRAVKRAMAFLAVLGTFGIAGLVAGAGRDSGSPRLAELTAADIIELRFPGEWTDLAATPAPAPVRLASADMSGPSYSLFAPQPIYALASSTHTKAPPPAVDMPEAPTATATVQPVAAPLPPTRPAASSDTGSQAKPHMQLASANAKPAAVPTTRSLGRPGAVLNDSQIASVKKRLKLTPDQERHWPAVEAALRNIQYKQNSGDPQRNSQRGTQTASVDPNSAGVQQLKSAAFPLVMSFSDDQRREVRTLAHVMGLDGVVSQF